ncbi:MAG: FAD-dependent oxidoreductase [Chloroflexi bacterium]|nr:FAD-dependent oxidoreductase [Chloroflexota bacterium]
MSHTNLTVYGAHWCPDCRRAKKFLGEQLVHFDWVDIEKDADARAYVEKVNQGKRIIPTIVFADGSFLVEPSNAQLAQKLGLQAKAKMQFYDLIVIGAGPAGLTTAIYAAREGIETLVIERSGLGGQASITGAIDNFPGFPEGLSGAEFAERVTAQARRFGVEILQAQEVERIEATDDYRIVHLRDASLYCARAVLLATGATYRKLNARGEDDFIGAGIHFCATCDGPFYKDAAQIVVIGGGNSAVEEALFLTKFAKRVTLIVRGEKLTASQFAQEKILAQPDTIEIKFNTSVTEFRGKGKLRSIVIQNAKTNAVEELHSAAVFIFIGQVPNSQLVRDLVACDEWGYVKTGHDLAHHGERVARVPAFMETSARGIFAAGDVRAGSTKQVASAVGEGASAAISIREFLKGE